MAKKSGSENGPLVGVRGGTTTLKRGMVRKNLWIPRELEEALRRKSFHERRSQTDIMLEALRDLLGVEDG